MSNLHEVDWSTIPAPADDGAANHLNGTSLPSVALPDTNGNTVDIGALSGLVVIYATR